MEGVSLGENKKFMADLPLVSIITIVYNGKKFIEQTIKSVLSQTYFKIEYIIIDGGSTDGTIDIIRKYQDSLAYWVSEPDKGISDAFNKGIKRARGVIVGVINADDWYEKDAVEHVVRSMHAADVLYGNMRIWKEGKVDFELEGNHNLLEKEMTINHPTVFVRKECYERYGVFDETFKCAMDYELMLRFYKNGCVFFHLPHVLANLRWEGFSDKNWRMGCKETLKAKNIHFPQKKISNNLYYLKHLMAIGLPKLLEKTPFHFIVKFYRRNFSRVKKNY